MRLLCVSTKQWMVKIIFKRCFQKQNVKWTNLEVSINSQKASCSFWRSLGESVYFESVFFEIICFAIFSSQLLEILFSFTSTLNKRSFYIPIKSIETKLRFISKAHDFYGSDDWFS